MLRDKLDEDRKDQQQHADRRPAIVPALMGH